MGAVFLREDVARDRNAIAELPAPFSCHCVADQGARALLDECLARVGGNFNVIAVELEVGLRLNRHHDQKILRILVVAAEPIEVRDLPHTLDGPSAVVVGDRQRLGEIDLVDHDQAIISGDILARVKGTLEPRKYAEDRKSDQDRDDHQSGAKLLAKKIFADEY